MVANTISNDLVWEISRNYSSVAVRRCGADLSRSPLNLTNKYTRVQEGLFNDKAVGIQSSPEGLTVLVKKSGKANKPASGVNSYTITSSTPSRKAYRSIANSVVKSGYRSDLNGVAISRASALLAAKRPVKASPAPKLRGAAKARAAAKETQA